MQLHFSPIAGRELLAASRRRITFRLRWLVALIGIAATFIWYGSGPATMLPAGLIGSLFTVQTLCAFGFALLAGPFLAADCLSEEKRDGTLGLLFLTGLKAGQIVLGKFAGSSVNAIYVLLALVPVTAVPILLGGVGLAEFLRMALALVNTLFFSLAVGLGVSAFVTDYWRGVVSTLTLLALFGVFFPIAATLVPTLGGGGAWELFAWFSPYFPYRYARDLEYVVAPARFWIPLAVSHAVGWFGLALAGARLRRSWQDRDRRSERSARRVRSLRLTRRPRTSHSADDEAFDPMLRLVGPAPFLRPAVWLIVLAWGLLLCANRFWPLPGFDDRLAARACAFLLKILVALQACRFFVETRRSGALELLFCTPLRNADLVRAQWRGLLRVFLWPLVCFLLFSWIDAAFDSAPGRIGRSLRVNPVSDLEAGPLGAFMLGIRLAADVLALGWFGMWLALRVRRPGLAPALTIVAVLVLPTLLWYFDLVADMLFISWGTTRLREEFRWLAVTPQDRDAR